MKRKVLALPLLFLLLSVAAALPQQSSGAAAARPNVLIIISDDQPESTMSLMPNVNRLFGEEGTDYPNGYASTALCCPARASILTGQHVHNHRVDGNSTIKTARFPFARSVQVQMKSAGYKTSLFGKFLNGWEGRPSVRGFDTYWGNKGFRFEQDREITRQFIKFINSQEGQDSKPWLTVLGYHSPHGPWKEPGARYPWNNKPPSYNEADLSDKPPYIAREKAEYDSEIARGIVPSNEEIRQGQMREVALLDETIKTVFSYLDRKGEGRNTLAFYISDQGYLWGQHGVQGKYLPYREVLEVPIMMRWPARVAGGQADTRLASSVDITPTIYDAAGLAPSYTPDGRSLLDVGNKRSWLFAEMAVNNDNEAWTSYITPTVQYIETRYGGNLFREYYNLTTDPFQIKSQLPPGGVASLEAALAQASTCVGPTQCN